MYRITRTATFASWLRSLDEVTQGRILKRLLKAQGGHLGDVKSLGGGIHEMREHFGCGYRIYFTKRGQ